MERETARHARGHRLSRSYEAASPAYPHPSRPDFSRSRSVVPAQSFPPSRIPLSGLCPTAYSHPSSPPHCPFSVTRRPSPTPVTRRSTLNCFSHDTNTSCERESTITRTPLPLIHIHRAVTHDRNVANSTARCIPSAHGNSSTLASHALHVGIPRSIAHLTRRSFAKNEPAAY